MYIFFSVCTYSYSCLYLNFHTLTLYLLNIHEYVFECVCINVIMSECWFINVYGAVYKFVGLLFDYEHYCPMGHMTKVLLLHVRLRLYTC